MVCYLLPLITSGMVDSSSRNMLTCFRFSFSIPFWILFCTPPQPMHYYHSAFPWPGNGIFLHFYFWTFLSNSFIIPLLRMDYVDSRLPHWEMNRYFYMDPYIWFLLAGEYVVHCLDPALLRVLIATKLVLVSSTLLPLPRVASIRSTFSLSPTCVVDSRVITLPISLPSLRPGTCVAVKKKKKEKDTMWKH